MDGTGAPGNSVHEEGGLDLDSRMDDPNIEAIIVEQLKAQGIFDKFRKDCLADADTKPAYQNLKHRVDSEVSKFLKNKEWNPTLNRNVLRNQLRSYMQGMDYSSGVDRIVDQLVNPELTGRIMPEVEQVVKDMFGNPLTTQENGVQNEIVENGCEQMEENGEVSSNDVDMEAQGEEGAHHQHQVPMTLRPGMIPPPPPPDAHSASSNGGDSSPGLAGQISPLTPGRQSANSMSPPPAPNSPSIAAGAISPLTPTRGGDISPLTPPAPPPPPQEENSHDIPAVGADEGEVAMEVDSHTPPGSPPTPSFTPPLPRNSFIPPHPVPMRRPLTPHTPPLPALPPIPPAALDLESGGEASMSSISDGDMPDVSPPRQSPRSPSSSNDDDAPPPLGPHRRMQATAGEGDDLLQRSARDDSLQRSASDISDTELPSVGSDRPDSVASADRAASKESGEAGSEDRGGSAASSAVPSTPPGEATSVEDGGDLELLEEERKRLMAKLEQDFHLSPESESEGEYHSDEEGDKSDGGDQEDISEEVKKAEASNEDESNPPAEEGDMSPVSEISISVTPVPAIADPSSRPVSTEPLSSSSSLPDSPRAPSREAPHPPPPPPETLPSTQPEASPSSRHSASPQASNISPNQLLRMRGLPLPAAKSLNTAQVLKTLPFPEGEGRPPPPEVETSRKGPQTPPPPPCEPWERPRGPRTPEPQFSPDRKSRTPSPDDSEPLYYEQQNRSPTSPPSPPTAFGRRGPRTPPLPPSSPPPSSSFERLELSEDSRNSELQSGCKPFEPIRRDSRDSDGGGGSGGRSGGVQGAPPGGAPVASSGSTESKPSGGSTSETVPTNKAKIEKKKELINKQQKAKIDKYDKKIKTNEKMKSDKFLDLDIFSTVKTPKTPHIPHRKPQDSGQKSPLVGGSSKTPTSSRTSSSSSKTLDYKKGKSGEPFLKPGKIPDRRSSSDIRKESEGNSSSSRDHESRSSSAKDKERRSSTSSDKDKGRSRDSRDRERDSKERERHKDRHGKDKEREKAKDRDSKERERDRHKESKEKERRKSDIKHSEKPEGEKSRKNSGEDESKKVEKLDKVREEKQRERSKSERSHGEKSEDDVKRVKSRKDSGEDDKKNEYASNFEEAKQKLAALREKKEKEEKERKKKIELEKKEEKAKRKQLEKEKEAEKKKEILNLLNGLNVKDIKKLLEEKLVEKVKKDGGDHHSKDNKKSKPVVSDDDSEEDSKVERRRSKSGESTKNESKSSSSEKSPKKALETLSAEKNAKKKPVISSDDDSSDDSSDDEDVKNWIEKNQKNKLKSEDSASQSEESPGRSTRLQMIKTMKERPVKVTLDKSLTKNIDVSWFNKEKKGSPKIEGDVSEENAEMTRVKINENDNVETGATDKNENNVVVTASPEGTKRRSRKEHNVENEKIEKRSHSKEIINNEPKRRGRGRKSSAATEDVMTIGEQVMDDKPIREGYDQLLRDKQTLLFSSTEDDSSSASSLPKLVSHLAARNIHIEDVEFLLEQEIKASKEKTLSTDPAGDKLQSVDDTLKPHLQSPGAKPDSPQSPSQTEDRYELQSPAEEKPELHTPSETKPEPQSPAEEKPDLLSPGRPKPELQTPVEEKPELQSPHSSSDLPKTPGETKSPVTSPVKEEDKPEPFESVEDGLKSPSEVTEHQLVSPSVAKEEDGLDGLDSPSVTKAKHVSFSPTNENLISPSVTKAPPISPKVNKEKLPSPTSPSVTKAILTSPGSPEKRGKKRSSGAKWDYVLEPILPKPAPKTKIEKQLLINNGAIDYLESAGGSAKRPRKANVKYSEEFTTVDSDDDAARSLSKPSPANSSTRGCGSKRQVPSSETLVTTPKKDSVINPSSTDISPGGSKRTSSTQIIRKYMASAGVQRPLEGKSGDKGSISSPENPARAHRLTQEPAQSFETSNEDLIYMNRQLDSEIAATDKEIEQIKSFLLTKRKKARASAQKSRARKEFNPSAWNTLLKMAIKKVKAMKQSANVERIGGAVRRSQASLKDVSDEVVEEKLEEAVRRGVIERLEKQGKVTYRIAIRGLSSTSPTDPRRTSDDLEASKTSSVDLDSSRLSSEVSNQNDKSDILDSSDDMEDLHGFSSKDIHEPKRIVHFDTFDRLEASGAMISSLDELKGVSLNDDLLKREDLQDEEFFRSSHMEVIFSPEIQTYIDNLKKLEQDHLDTVKGRGKPVGKSEDLRSDEADDKGSSSPESFGSSKENQPTVSGVMAKAKRNQTPNKFIQEATRKRRSGIMQEGQSLKTRKVS